MKVVRGLERRRGKKRSDEGRRRKEGGVGEEELVVAREAEKGGATAVEKREGSCEEEEEPRGTPHFSILSTQHSALSTGWAHGRASICKPMTRIFILTVL